MTGEVIYVVDLVIDADAHAEFEAWLREHLQQMLSIDGFESARWYQRECPGDDSARVLRSVHYRVRDRAALARYFEVDAPRMRGEGLRRFEGRFEATRSVLTLCE